MSSETEKASRPRGGSLTFPADPLAAMRELSDLDAPPPTPDNSRTPVNTGLREPVDTEARTDGSTEVRENVSPQARQDGRTAGRAQARKPARADGGTGGSADGSPDLLAAVEAALQSREPLVGGVKATVDMSPDLSTRARRYLADNRGQSTRQVLIALLDAYLAAKGY